MLDTGAARQPNVDATVLAAQLERLRQQHQAPPDETAEQMSPQDVLRHLQEEAQGEHQSGPGHRQWPGAGGTQEDEEPVDTLGESTSESAPADQRVYPKTLDPNDPTVRVCTFEDIGAQTQYAWCDASHLSTCDVALPTRTRAKSAAAWCRNAAPLISSRSARVQVRAHVCAPPRTPAHWHAYLPALCVSTPCSLDRDGALPQSARAPRRGGLWPR